MSATLCTTSASPSRNRGTERVLGLADCGDAVTAPAERGARVRTRGAGVLKVDTVAGRAGGRGGRSGVVIPALAAAPVPTLCC